MVRKVTLQKINELQEKFKLQEIQNVPSPWLLNESIQPTTDVDILLSTPSTTRSEMGGITTAIETPIFFLAPGMRWVVRGIYAKVIAGDAKFKQINFWINNAGIGFPVLNSLTEITEGQILFPTPIELREGDYITALISSVTTTSTIRVTFIFDSRPSGGASAP